MMKDEILEKLQQTELELLIEIDRLCRMYNLKYYLVGGTLLGAVRHGGFIPWDDDLDIALPREDFNKLVQICRSDLKKEYFIHWTTTDPEYWLPFAKLKKNHTIFDEKQYSHLNTHKGIFIDIFPLDTTNKSETFSLMLRAKFTRIIRNYLWWRRDIIQIESMGKKIIYCLGRCLSLKSWANIRDKVMAMDNKKSPKYVTNLGSNYHYKKQTMPMEYYEPATLISFEKMEFRAPGNYKKYLEQLYGDYMELPPESERRNHNPVKIIFDTRI